MPDPTTADRVRELLEEAESEARATKAALSEAQKAHDHADTVAKALRMAVEKIDGTAGAREPEGSNGEHRDDELAEQVKQAKEAAA
jgi:hypothetical protein